MWSAEQDLGGFIADGTVFEDMQVITAGRTEDSPPIFCINVRNLELWPEDKPSGNARSAASARFARRRLHRSPARHVI